MNHEQHVGESGSKICSVSVMVSGEDDHVYIVQLSLILYLEDLGV